MGSPAFVHIRFACSANMVVLRLIMLILFVPQGAPSGTPSDFLPPHDFGAVSQCAERGKHRIIRGRRSRVLRCSGVEADEM